MMICINLLAYHILLPHYITGTLFMKKLTQIIAYLMTLILFSCGTLAPAEPTIAQPDIKTPVH